MPSGQLGVKRTGRVRVIGIFDGQDRAHGDGQFSTILESCPDTVAGLDADHANCRDICLDFELAVRQQAGNGITDAQIAAGFRRLFDDDTVKRGDDARAINLQLDDIGRCLAGGDDGFITGDARAGLQQFLLCGVEARLAEGTGLLELGLALQLLFGERQLGAGDLKVGARRDDLGLKNLCLGNLCVMVEFSNELTRLDPLANLDVNRLDGTSHLGGDLARAFGNNPADDRNGLRQWLGAHLIDANNRGALAESRAGCRKRQCKGQAECMYDPSHQTDLSYQNCYGRGMSWVASGTL